MPHFILYTVYDCRLQLHAGDDAIGVQWLEIGDHVAQYTNLYASHKVPSRKVSSANIGICASMPTPFHVASITLVASAPRYS